MGNLTFVSDFRQFGWGWRVWMLLLQLINLIGPLFFIERAEAWVVLAGYVFAAIVIVSLHRRLGWVRLLGIGHFIWFPILPWIALRYASGTPSGLFALWLLLVLTVDSICLVIDVVDVFRYIAGDRAPIVSSDFNC